MTFLYKSRSGETKSKAYFHNKDPIVAWPPAAVSQERADLLEYAAPQFPSDTQFARRKIER